MSKNREFVKTYFDYYKENHNKVEDFLKFASEYISNIFGKKLKVLAGDGTYTKMDGTITLNQQSIAEYLSKDSFKDASLCLLSDLIHEYGHYEYTNKLSWDNTVEAQEAHKRGLTHIVMNSLEDGRIESFLMNDYMAAVMPLMYSNQKLEKQYIEANRSSSDMEKVIRNILSLATSYHPTYKDSDFSDTDFAFLNNEVQKLIKQSNIWHLSTTEEIGVIVEKIIDMLYAEDDKFLEDLAQNHQQNNNSQNGQGQGQGQDGQGSDSQDGQNGEGSDSQDGQNGEGSDSQDGQNGDSQNGQGSDSQDGQNGDSQNGEGSDSQDGQNGDSQNGEGSDSQDGQNGDSQNGQGSDSQDGQNGDSQNGQGSDSQNGQGSDSQNSQSNGSKSGQASVSTSKDVMQSNITDKKVGKGDKSLKGQLADKFLQALNPQSKDKSLVDNITESIRNFSEESSGNRKGFVETKSREDLIDFSNLFNSVEDLKKEDVKISALDLLEQKYEYVQSTHDMSENSEDDKQSNRIPLFDDNVPSNFTGHENIETVIKKPSYTNVEKELLKVVVQSCENNVEEMALILNTIFDKKRNSYSNTRAYIDDTKFVNIAFDNYDIFKGYDNEGDNKKRVFIAVDLSGSMLPRYSHLLKGLLTLHRVLKKLGIVHSIWGYNTGHNSAIHYPLVLVDNCFEDDVEYNLMSMKMEGANRDGFSYRVFNQYITENRMDLFIALSDGNPNDKGYTGEAAIEDTKEALEEIGIPNLGVCIGDIENMNVSKVFDTVAECEDVVDLSQVLFDALLDVLV